MYEKYKITGTMELLSGLHIRGEGTCQAFHTIDETIMRDAWTDLPIIPGSSFKGKLRTLLATWMGDGKLPNDPADDPEKILRLFGTNKRIGDGKIPKARLQFCDMHIKKESLLKLEEHSIFSPTEIKTELSINRLTMEAKKREIERVIRGVEFGFEIIYNVEFEDGDTNRQKQILEEIQNDFEIIRVGLDLLEADYLGGKGNSGYGRVAFHDMHVDLIFGNSSVAKYNQILCVDKERK